MFPPDSTTTTGPSTGSAAPASTAAVPERSAATPVAPAGSTSSFARSATMSRDREISSSVTVRTSTPCCARIPNGTAPGVPTAMPSAIVAASRAVVGVPAASEPG